MRPILLTAVDLCAISTAASADPRKLWQAGGFKSPGSTLYDADAKADVIYVSNANGPLVNDPALKGCALATSQRHLHD
jgi:hypothetical protein